MTFPTTTRTLFVDAKHSCMRVQTGRYQRRPMQVPDFGGSLGRTLIGHRISNEEVEVFHLLAWGETEEDAECMLKRDAKIAERMK